MTDRKYCYPMIYMQQSTKIIMIMVTMKNHPPVNIQKFIKKKLNK